MHLLLSMLGFFVSVVLALLYKLIYYGKTVEKAEETPKIEQKTKNKEIDQFSQSKLKMFKIP